MSLILDALRRADSERERGAVPGLHAQPVSVPIETAPRFRVGPWHWAAAGFTGVLLVALAWYIVAREAPRQAAATAAPPPSSTAPPASPTVGTMPPAPASTAAAVSAAAASTPDVQQVAEPARWPSSDGRKAPEARIATAPVEPRPEEKVVAPVSTVQAEPPVYSREQLPENIRTGLPQLVVGGSIYSADAASRSVIINGRIYRENDRLTNDLSLEQIKLKAAVLRYKGYRFEIQF